MPEQLGRVVYFSYGEPAAGIWRGERGTPFTSYKQMLQLLEDYDEGVEFPVRVEFRDGTTLYTEQHVDEVVRINRDTWHEAVAYMSDEIAERCRVGVRTIQKIMKRHLPPR